MAGSPILEVMVKHRKWVNTGDLAAYFGVHRNTMRVWLGEAEIDLRDLESVLDFVVQKARSDAQSGEAKKRTHPRLKKIQE